jgi:lipid-A-disaccharide synthase
VKVFISAGEASGDALGASLQEALQTLAPGVETYGLGGPRMVAGGFRALRDARELSVMGLFEVLRHLPRLFRLRDALAAAALADRPDVAVLVDAPDFNIRLAEKLHAAGIPVLFYVGPSVWAWRPGRVKRYRPHIDKLLVLFPFEVPIWQAAGVDVECVGHPLVEEVPEPAPAALVEAKTVALLPGSRRGEIRRHLALMLEAARRLVAEAGVERFVLPVAPTLDAAWLAEYVQQAGLTDRVELVEDPAGPGRRAAIARAAAALVVSGTATLETALVGRPQVIFYRVHWLTYAIGRRLMRVRHFGLPNIILGREVATELLQGELTPERLAAEAKRLLVEPAARAAALEACRSVRAALPPAGAGLRAARAVLALAGRAPH